jgi:hypothetical protein
MILLLIKSVLKEIFEEILGEHLEELDVSENV